MIVILSTKIGAIEHSLVYKKFASALRKERVAIKKTDSKTEYIALYYEDNPIGVVGWQYMGKGHYRLKTDYVNPAFRRKGYYSELWKTRISLIFTNKVETLSAFCTEMSLPTYLKNGFTAISNKNGITYVKKQT